MRADVAKAGCRGSGACRPAHRTFARQANPLVWKKGWYCQGSAAGYRVTTAIWLTDAAGARTAKVEATLVCKRR